MRSYKSYLRSLLLLLVTAVCFIPWAGGQTTLYSETFTGQEGKGATGPGPIFDLSGVTWTIDVSAASLGSGDYFQVVNGVLEGLDTDGDAIWYSPSVNISGYVNVSFVLVASEPNDLETADYYDVEYRVDGGAWKKIINWNNQGNATHTLIENWTGETVGQSGLSGSTLELRVTMRNDSDNERMRLDNVVVIGGLPNLIINEVSYNPCPSQGTDGNCEFIEIYNAGGAAVNLSGYQLDGSVEYTFGSVSIPAGGYIVVARNAGTVSACYGGIPGGVQIFDWGTESLSNTSGSIYLINNNGVVLDQFSYDDGNSCPNADDNCASLQFTGGGDNTDCTAGNWAADTPSPGAENSSVLPIELLVFSGKAVEEAVHLTWTTASELNNDYMAVERSADGRSFEEIGRVTGSGTTYGSQTYAFVDNYPMPGVNYYRLRQVDFDGTTEYHPVISVVFKGQSRQESKLLVYPNPAREEIRVRWAAPAPPQPPQRGGDGTAEAVVRILDMSGRVVAQHILTPPLVGAEVAVPVQQLPVGVYILQLMQGGSVQVQKFVKE